MPRAYIYNVSRPGVEFFFWQLEETPVELASLIDGGDALLCEAVEKFKSVERQREWIAARALLQQAGYGHVINYKPDGAPYLSGCGKHISISHTVGMVALAISDKPVGIDIEASARNVMRVAHMLVGKNGVPVSDNSEALCLWTSKEAAYKLFPEKAVTITDIMLERVADDGASIVYNAIYPCGTVARCSVCLLGDYVLACCSL